MSIVVTSIRGWKIQTQCPENDQHSDLLMGSEFVSGFGSEAEVEVSVVPELGPGDSVFVFVFVFVFDCKGRVNTRPM